jgi:DNA (cytosine-5)-methyltransferase 1
MKSIELFSGAGGLALGIHLAGFEHQLLVEADEDAYETLSHNSENEAVPGIKNWSIFHDRVENVDLGNYGKIDLLAAGIPCQPFSNGGKRRGVEDERNMFPIFAKALATVRPKAFLLENAHGLINGRLASQMEYIVKQLEYPWHQISEGQAWSQHFEELRCINRDHADEGKSYKVWYKVMNAADYGVPQIRKRVFMVGFRTDLRADWKFPETTHSKDALLASRSHNGAGGGIDGNQKSAWRTVEDDIRDLPETRSDNSKDIQHALIPGARSYRGHTGSSLYWPAKSLKAGTHGVGGGENMLHQDDGSVRYFTVRECARLQTFPDSWIFKGAWSSVTRQLGNAVPVKMATVVAKSIREALENSVE